MLDNVRLLVEQDTLGPPLSDEKYILATLHRAELTSHPQKLLSILKTLDSSQTQVFLPLHPRTKTVLQENRAYEHFSNSLNLISPLGYREILGAVQGASRVVTDSGGLQKEAYFLGKPCITVRPETEWKETVSVGWNRLVGLDSKALEHALDCFDPTQKNRPNLYGKGDAADKISAILLESLSS